MKIIAIILWGGLAWAQVASSMAPISPGAKKPTQDTASIVPESPTDANSLLPDLSAPKGKATLLGGTITRLDRVRDQIVIRTFGGGDMEVLFDGRTHISSDGSKASSHDLHIGQKAYVDTVLDGTTIFAKNIRVLSHGALGESRGQIVTFDRSRSEMTLNDGLSPEPFKVRILPGSKIISKDQETSTNALQPGTLVAVEFRPAQDGSIAAQQISILAERGTSFTFVGKVIFLNLHQGLIVLTDPRDKKNYEVHFNPTTVHINGDLHPDSEVTVNAAFDGTKYATNAIMVTPSAD